MKTEAQWDHLWDSLFEGRGNFRTARKLLNIYTGYENKGDAQWEFYPLALFNRLIAGRWNTHHDLQVQRVVKKYLMADFVRYDWRPDDGIDNPPSDPLADLMADLSIVLADRRLNKNGDLANILRLIKKNTGYSINVKYEDFAFDRYAALTKYFVDAVKPWKSTYYFWRDLSQPLVGLFNTLKGFMSAVAIPFIFIRHLFDLISGPANERQDNAYLMLREPFNYLINAVDLLSIGFIQLLTTPFTYAFKLPLRLVLTGIDRYFDKQPLIEEDVSIQLARKPTGEVNDVATIHRKFQKGIQRGRPTKIDPASELTFFKAAQFLHASTDANDPRRTASTNEDDVHTYMRLFKLCTRLG